MKCSILQMQKELRVDKPSDRPESTASRKMPVLKEANTSSPLKRTFSSSFKNSIHAPLRSPLSVCVPKPATVGASSPKSTVLNRTNSTSKSLRQIMNNQLVNNTSSNNNENLSLSGELDPLRSPMRPNGNGVYIRLRTPEGSFRSSTCSQDVVIEAGELRRGYEVAGCLYKWVNYGKGWKSRWFVLREGVLSYYKIHGPDKIAVTEETEKGLKVIGEHSVELMMRKKPKSSAANTSGRKTAGIVHLKVSSVRESKSDDKKFSIFSGTKTLHLRAETREDRAAWVEALATAKEQFPSSSLSMGHLLPIQEITVSTEKLRNRLQEAGLNEDIIKDCEDIMLAEFSKLQDELDSLQQRGCTLIDTLRQLEAEKVELETTVVDESQYRSKARHYSTELGQGKSSGTATESDDDNERANGAELESDEEDDAFFDTTESLSDSFRGSGSGFRRLSTASEDELIDCEDFSDDSNGADSESEIHGLGFPRVERRKSLPEPVEKEKGVSLWSMIKDNIGKDLTRVCLPVYFNEPLSSLQKCFEDLEYSYLIDRANEFGKKGNNLMRILNVAAFAVSAYASSEGRNCKPFNPLLGETYEAEYPDKGLHFLAEKVSHHPMLIACHCEGRGWKFWGDSNLKSKFWGRSIQLDPVGVLSLQFDDGEVFQWSKVTTSIYNLILGKLYCDHYGTMRIQGNGEYTCKLKFKEQSIIDRNPHQVQGFVQDKSGKKVATLLGKWDESMFYVIGDITSKPKGYDPMSEACLLWKRSKPPKNPTRYNLTSFAITLNELTPGLKENLPPTDSRLRPDQRYLENGQYELANSEKLRLEQRQRQSRKLQETGWQPRWFRKEKGHDTYKYVGGYWEARDKHQWNDCLDVFGQTSDDTANE